MDWRREQLGPGDGPSIELVPCVRDADSTDLDLGVGRGVSNRADPPLVAFLAGAQGTDTQVVATAGNPREADQGLVARAFSTEPLRDPAALRVERVPDRKDRDLRRATGRVQAVGLETDVPAALRMVAPTQRELVRPEISLGGVELGREVPLEAVEPGEGPIRYRPPEIRVGAARRRPPPRRGRVRHRLFMRWPVAGGPCLAYRASHPTSNLPARLRRRAA